MRRREFITLFSGAVTWPIMARAQQLARMPHIVQLSPVDIPSQADQIRRDLHELGYAEGRNIRLEFRNAAGNVDALPALAKELVQQGGIDAIIALSTPAALAAHQATQTIPIVAFTAVDPVGSGLADSLAHPGHNVTGIAVSDEKAPSSGAFLPASLMYFCSGEPMHFLSGVDRPQRFICVSIYTANDCQGNGSKSTRLASVLTPPSPSA